MGASAQIISLAAETSQVAARRSLPGWRDPRLLQIAFLTMLLGGGAALRDFDLGVVQIVLTFVAAFTVQGLLGGVTRQKPISWRSALITSLSLSLLLRADNLWVHPLAAALAIASKFALRIRRKHLFNPANFGVVVALILLPGAWLSPGQWGQELIAAGWIALLGATVATRARSADISLCFLTIYAGLLALRTAWLGQNWLVPIHQLSNGALLLFAFFMISDPMTIPDRRRGRIVHAGIVALLAYCWQFELYRTNGFIWALFSAAPLVSVWDRAWPGSRYQWTTQGDGIMSKNSLQRPKRFAFAAFFLVPLLLIARTGFAFCGFYVGKADTGLYNHASQVVYVRNGDRNVLSIMNDYAGQPAEFALVVPVPVVLQKSQIHIGDRELFQRLDAYSAPRLVEYYDPDPCALPMDRMMAPSAAGALSENMAKREDEKARALGITIAARYTVGEYDIVILSATQSDGLETWLLESGYKLPVGVSRALQPYIRQKLKFFVAKVNLQEHERTGLSYLRPLQFAFDSAKFILPIRLGMINAQGPQDLIIYMLTKDGRVETTNYRTAKVPAGMDLPEYIRDDFGGFYKALFDRQVNADEMHAVFTEYVWNMGWCDPCAAPPLSQDQLRQLGVFWLVGDLQSGGIASRPNTMMRPFFEQVPAVLTRLHVRYSATTFPEDLAFQETADRENFQASYVLRHAWNGAESVCPAAKSYFEELHRRRETEATTLADLTGWKLDDVYQRVGLNRDDGEKPSMWWEQLWR
jgi:Na+-translocating ferredoxin:NAD+ oxidoreductase RnfD subunit